MKYCFSEFYKVLKKYAKDLSISDENFCNALLSTLIKNNKLTNRYNGEIYLDKARISKLVNGRDEIPQKIKSILDASLTSMEVKGSFNSFIKSNLSSNKAKELANTLSELISKSSNIDEKELKLFNEESRNTNATIFNSFMISLNKSNKKVNENKTIWQNGANKIALIDGDIFNTKSLIKGKERAIIVIPVNTGFDTHITRNYESNNKPLVSDKTIHGYWLNKIFKAGIDEDRINKLIDDSLKSQKIKTISVSKSKNGNKNIYPIGTIAVVQYNREIYYLLAISNFDENNKAHSNKKELTIAIEKLARFYDENGQGYKMFVPLIGTGRSRAQLSHQESFDLIVNTLTKNLEYINGEIYIVNKDGKYRRKSNVKNKNLFSW